VRLFWLWLLGAEPVLPLLCAELDCLANVCEGRHSLVKLNKLIPSRLLDPFSVGLWKGDGLVSDTDCTSQEEQVLVAIDLA